MSTETNIKRFRIAFSFAGEKRDFVEATARILAQRFGEERILYDKFHEAEFARYDLGIYLPKLYGEQSELLVPVLCANYDQKRWTGWEWGHIYGLLTKADGHRVMPSRFDYANADGLSSAAGYIELDEKTPAEFADLILQRLKSNQVYAENHYVKGIVNLKHSNHSSEIQSSADLAKNSDELHKNHALELLLKSEPYLAALKLVMQCHDAAEIINQFSTCVAEDVRKLFDCTRKALNKVRFDGLVESEKHEVYEAVTALYMLAAMRLIDVADSKLGNHVLLIPRNDEIICAIIATALFGGCLKIIPDYQNSLPKPEYVFEVYASAAGDYVTASFERAIYAAIYQNNRKVDLSTLDSKELNKDETSDLLERLHSIRGIDEHNLCLVVTAGITADRAVSVSDKFRVPTIFKSDETATVLLGMTYEDLIAAIKEFWRQIDNIRNQHQPAKTATGEQPVSNVQNNFYASIDSLALAQGDSAIAQAGTGQSVTVNQQTGMQISELANLINHQIIEAINAHPSEKSRNALKSHLVSAQQELAKPKRDKNLIEKSLELVKGLGDGIDGAEKIVELCMKALPLLSSLPAVF
ncbi:MAG: hypothetical protein ACXWFG_04870 [Methylobacter sp.]